MIKLFGTDGIRGKANVFPLTIDICFRLAEALVLQYTSCSGTVLIGKDTRISSDMFESALAAAFSSFGVEVKLIGVSPTPAISLLVKSSCANLGIMISASHNQFSDNGIKIFNCDGYKLSSEDESNIEKIIDDTNVSCEKCIDEKIGRITHNNDLLSLYIKKTIEPFRRDKKKYRIVTDSANGSFSKIASKVFCKLGYEIISEHEQPNGININANCGATHPEEISALVLKHKADIGVAFDGDGDRVIITDECGNIIDGNYILAILAEIYNPKTIVSTIMTNYGLEQYLRSKNIELIKTNVGDKYVSEKMRETGAICGGESSGHIIISEHAVTGDGLFAALKIIEYLISSGKKASSITKLFAKSPSVNKNIKVKDKEIMQNQKISDCIEKFKKKLEGRGKLIVRVSGTEDVIRITAEGNDEDELTNIVDLLCAAIFETERI